MATGTGKTYTAFQIIWRLWKSGAKKRILFLVDRNILADQTKTNDFKPFGKAMTKITNRTVDKSFEIYLCLYQAVTGVQEDSWQAVLRHFDSAAQIGLPLKETRSVSTIEYFCEPNNLSRRLPLLSRSGKYSPLSG